MRVGLLLGIIVLLTGCKDEPEPYFCVYLGTDNPMACSYTHGDKPDFDSELKVGDICTVPKQFGKAKKHHGDLHRRLDRK